MTLIFDFNAIAIGQDDPSIPNGTMSLWRMVKKCVFEEPKKFPGGITAKRGHWVMRY